MPSIHAANKCTPNNETSEPHQHKISPDGCQLGAFMFIWSQVRYHWQMWDLYRSPTKLKNDNKCWVVYKLCQLMTSFTVHAWQKNEWKTSQYTKSSCNKVQQNSPILWYVHNEWLLKTCHLLCHIRLYVHLNMTQKLLQLFSWNLVLGHFTTLPQAKGCSTWAPSCTNVHTSSVPL